MRLSSSRMPVWATGLAACLLSSCGAGALGGLFGSSGGGGGGTTVTDPGTGPVNSAPVVSSLDVPSMTTGQVPFPFVLSDADGDAVSVGVEWRNVTSGGAFQPATLASPLSGLPATPQGAAFSGTWSSNADLGPIAATVELRLTPNDGTETGASLVSAPFVVDNEPVITNEPPVLSNLSVPAMGTGPIDFGFDLADPNGDTLSVAVEWRDVTSGGGFVPATLESGPLTGLPGSPQGMSFSAVWNSSVDLGPVAATVELRLTPSDGLLDGAAVVSTTIAIDNEPTGSNTIPVISNLVVADEAEGPVPIGFEVADADGDTLSVSVEWRDVGAGGAFARATLLTGPLMGLPGLPQGVTVSTTWDSETDLGPIDAEVELRLIPNDGTENGVPVLAQLDVDNDSTPPASPVGIGPSFDASTDVRGFVAVPFEIDADELDDPLLLLQWRRDDEIFPAVPSERSIIETALASPDTVERLNLAPEAPLTLDARIAGVQGSSVRIDALARRGDPFLLRNLVGETLQLLEAGDLPTSRDELWPTSSFSQPITALTSSAGTLIVLDSATSGTWRLREFDATTGQVLRTIASASTGSGRDVAWSTQDDELVLLENAFGGQWSVKAIDFGSGSTQTVFSSAGTVPEGSARGVAAGPGIALVTVGTSLLRVDRSGASASASVLRDGLQTPWGVARDPRDASAFFLAERDWRDASNNLVGRITSVDVEARTLRPVTSAANALRPRAIAYDVTAGRLLAVTDLDGGDGTAELCSIEPTPTGGLVELLGGQPADLSGLNVDASGRIVMTWPEDDDVALGGGVVAERTVTSFSAVDRTLGLSSALPSGVGPGARVRLSSTISRPGAVTDEWTGNYLWDGASVPGGGRVAVRFLLYDEALVDSSEPSALRVIEHPSQVEPTFTGTAPGLTDITSADLDGDGAVDLAVCRPGLPGVAIFFNDGAGSFPSSPINIVASGGLVAGPSSLVAVDEGGNGLTDLATANASSSGVTVFSQVAPGAFAAPTQALGASLGGPLDLAAGDIDGNGLEDLACANSSGDDVAIFLQDAGGLPATQSLSVGGSASTPGPQQVVLTELDGDGQVDLLVACGGNDSVAVFLNTGGVFAATPSFTLGGPSVTGGLSAIAAGDVDGDGRTDIAVAHLSRLVLFLQSPAGTFPATPDVEIDVSGLTRSLALGDFDRDGNLDAALSLSDERVQVLLTPFDGADSGRRSFVIGGPAATPGVDELAVADLDGDGFVDLATANQAAGTVSVFPRYLDGDFAASPGLSLGNAGQTAGVTQAEAVDFDLDGDLDVIAVSQAQGHIALLRHLGAGVFDSGALTVSSGLSSTTAFATGYLDGDLFPDLVVTDTVANAVAVFLHTGDGDDPYVGPPQVVSLPGTPTLVAVGLLDGNIAPDLAVLLPATGQVQILHGGAGGFTLGGLLGGPGVLDAVSSIEIHDVDGDGREDVLCASPNLQRATLFRQTQTGFTLPLHLGGPGTTAGAEHATAADLDGDGHVDILVAAPAAGHLALFRGLGDGVFAPVPEILDRPELSAPIASVIADFDSDGRRDIAVADSAGARVFIRRGGFDALGADFARLLDAPGLSGLRAVDLDGDGAVDVLAPVPGQNAVLTFFGGRR